MRTRPATNGRTAQDRLVREIFIARPDETIAHLEQRLLEESRELETINYGYVTDQRNKLVGVFSIKELFRQPKNKHVRDFMHKDPVSVFPGTKQEKVVITALNHKIKGVPVVDSDHHLLGAVPSDAILDILHDEHTRHLLQMAGIRIQPDGKQLLEMSAWTAFRRRIPWLFVGLLGGIGSATIVDTFSSTLNKHVLLIAFIPAIMYMTAAVGTQTQTILIRAMATFRDYSVIKHVAREVQTSFLIATFISLFIGITVTFFWKEPIIAIVLGLAFFLAIFLESGISLFLPWLFNKLKLDPAISTGPSATILSDIMTLVIYFLIATLVITNVGLK